MGWENIPGYFNFEELYFDAVRRAPQGATLVEVGVYLGRSLAFMARCAIELKRDDLEIVGVDSFVGCQPEKTTDSAKIENSDDYNRVIYGSLENACREHLRIEAPAELARIKLDVSASTDAAKRYRPWFAFIDAAHDYASVLADIRAWEPVTSGALAGHDYDFGDVKRAVDEEFGCLVQVHRTSWFVSLRAKREAA